MTYSLNRRSNLLCTVYVMDPPPTPPTTPLLRPAPTGGGFLDTW